MIEILPHCWMRADLIHGWRIGDQVVTVASASGDLQHTFESVSLAMEWVRGIEIIYDAFFMAMDDDEE